MIQFDLANFFQKGWNHQPGKHLEEHPSVFFEEKSDELPWKVKDGKLQNLHHVMVDQRWGGTYCWWKKSGVHQLRLVVSPNFIYRALLASQVVGNGISEP